MCALLWLVPGPLVDRLRLADNYRWKTEIGLTNTRSLLQHVWPCETMANAVAEGAEVLRVEVTIKRAPELMA